MKETMESKLIMKMDAMKTKILVCSRENNTRTRIKVKGDKIIEQVGDFRCLGSIVSSDGRCKKEIVKRICQAKVVFNKKISFLPRKILTLISGKMHYERTSGALCYIDVKHELLQNKKEE